MKYNINIWTIIESNTMKIMTTTPKNKKYKTKTIMAGGDSG